MDNVARYRLTGVCPLIMHKSTLADPMDPLVAEYKKVSGKKKKTDEDHRTLSNIEWRSGLYLASDGETIIVPAVNIEAAIRDAAKRHKRGKDVQKGVIIYDDPPLHFEGPKDLAKLEGLREFRDRTLMRVGMARVMRTRPKFQVPWWVDVEVSFYGEVFNQREITQLLIDAGRLAGMCDSRPRSGRFNVEEIDD